MCRSVTPSSPGCCRWGWVWQHQLRVSCPSWHACIISVLATEHAFLTKTLLP